MDFDPEQLWRKHIDRQLYELGALVRGQVPTVSARIADVVEQVDELRKELEKTNAKLTKVADYVRANVPKKNGGTT
jgi:hypothetical protein